MNETQSQKKTGKVLTIFCLMINTDQGRTKQALVYCRQKFWEEEILKQFFFSAEKSGKIQGFEKVF